MIESLVRKANIGLGLSVGGWRRVNKVDFNLMMPQPQVNKGTEPLNVVYYNDREFEHE